MNKFLEWLQSGEIMVADGATGTNLQKMGIPPGTAPEELVIDQPDLILDLEKAFVTAGSDLILTCTFGGTSLRMKDSKYAQRTNEINSRAVELAHKAAASRSGTLVAGSIGPTGQLLKPFGSLSTEQATLSFADQAKALADGGVDLLVIETMFAFEEADAAFNGARSVTDLPIVVSFSYDRGVRTMMGVKPADMFKHYMDMGAVLIGANCGTTLENMEKIQQEYAEVEPGLPLWAKPNAGLPILVDGKTVYEMEPAEFAARMSQFVGMGAQIVGSCCGSSPAYISELAKRVG